MARLYRKKWSGGKKRTRQLKTQIGIGSWQRWSLANDLKIQRERYICLFFVVCGSKQDPEMQKRKEQLAG